MKRRMLGLIVVLVVCPGAFAQGSLQRAREAPPVATNSAPASNDTKADPNAANAGNGLGGADLTGAGLESLPFAAIGAAIVVSSPFWAPHYLLDDNLVYKGYFPAYPYPTDFPGYQRIASVNDNIAEGQEARPGDPDYLRRWGVRLSAEDGNDFHGMNRFNVRLFIDTTTRFGVLTNWNFLQERLDAGGSDRTTLGDTNLTFRFAQSETLQMHAGPGFRVRTDDVNTRWGFNFLYGADWYPVRPLVVSASLDLGSLGREMVWHGRVSAGANFRNLEAFAGYDFLRIGAVNIQGPMVGLRFWF